ncbi:MAG: hypothetical protein MRERC_4c007 [Mycoplasmataceae bacterium RC_NB112A]|nr:MAG: hypothetical protein MRERC_4c007 [Mycoplasmataceae bacterium RC_NB112A]
MYQTPLQGWWANYRWHIVKPSEKLGLKSEIWKKSLEIEIIDNAKKYLKFLQNGIITAYGGHFWGASYDKNAERIIKHTKHFLKEAIKNHIKVESVNIKKEAVVPLSYYNWRIIISISLGIMLVIGIILYRTLP